jgi:hypothetical protein
MLNKTGLMKAYKLLSPHVPELLLVSDAEVRVRAILMILAILLRPWRGWGVVRGRLVGRGR